MPPPVGGSLGGGPAVWSISHHRGVLLPRVYSTAASPPWLGLRGPPAWQRPPPGLCAGTRVIICFNGSGRRLPWSAIQPGRARTSGLGVPLLPLAWLVGWIAPVHPTWGCRRLRPVSFLPSVHVCVRCPGPCGACSPVCALCAVCVCCWWLCPSTPPLNFFSFLFFLFFFALSLFCFVLLLFFFLFFFKKEKGTRAHRRHRHGQLVHWCDSAVFFRCASSVLCWRPRPRGAARAS